jgi:hypothetical protein
MGVEVENGGESEYCGGSGEESRRVGVWMGITVMKEVK